MAPNDPYQQQWNLKPKIEALRAEAASAREQLAAGTGARRAEIGVARDQAAREQYAADQAAKSADLQVTREQRLAKSAHDEVAKAEADAAAAERRGDSAGATEHREFAIGRRTEVVEHETRARQARLDAAELRDESAGHARRVTELEVARQDVTLQARAAEIELDKIEERADLLQQAREEYGRVSLGVDNASESAAAELVARSEAIAVDRAAIRLAVPEFADTTPGIDAPPPPLPGDDAEPHQNDTDLMRPGDDPEPHQNDTDLMRPGDDAEPHQNDTDLMRPGDLDHDSELMQPSSLDGLDTDNTFNTLSFESPAEPLGGATLGNETFGPSEPLGAPSAFAGDFGADGATDVDSNASADFGSIDFGNDAGADFGGESFAYDDASPPSESFESFEG